MGDYGTVLHTEVEKVRQSLPSKSSNSRTANLFAAKTNGFKSVEGRKEQFDYQSVYSVKDPHMQFYNICRPRDKSKEIQGPIKMKLTSSYDRIKSELEMRKAIPGNAPHENWDVVPIIRNSAAVQSKHSTAYGNIGAANRQTSVKNKSSIAFYVP